MMLQSFLDHNPNRISRGISDSYSTTGGIGQSRVSTRETEAESFREFGDKDFSRRTGEKSGLTPSHTMRAVKVIMIERPVALSCRAFTSSGGTDGIVDIVGKT
jgi:hypothetical protein